MGLIKLECPSCGSHLEFSQDREVFFCEYCGTKVIKDKQYIELSGTVSVAGIASEESLLERAYMFLDDGDFLNADKYLEKVLDINPKCSKAYIGKLLTQLHIKNIEKLSQWSRPLSEYDYYTKALHFSTKSEKMLYESYNMEITNRILSRQNETKKKIEDVNNRIKPLESYLQENLKQNKKDKAKKVLWRVLLIISLLPVLFLSIGTIASGVWWVIFFDIPFIALSVFLLIKNITIDKKIKKYVEVEAELAALNQDKSEREYLYHQWCKEYNLKP